LIWEVDLLKAVMNRTENEQRLVSLPSFSYVLNYVEHRFG